MLLWLSLLGCTFPVAPCGETADCVSAFGVGWTCGMAGRCVAPDASGTDTTPVQSDTTVPDPTSDTGTDPMEPVLIINEVLYDPSNEPEGPDGLPGDANGDGAYVHNEDEFIELVNISGRRADVSGFSIYDNEAWDLEEARHVIDDGTVLEPGEALVVFGGGVPTGTFGNAVVQVASGTLNLNNASDELRITDAEGRVILTFDVQSRSDDPDESYTRNPDITGAFEQHADNTKLLFSPGTRVDGTPFL